MSNARRDVVFITSQAGATPLFGMRASPEPHEPIFWDYHVILVEYAEDGPFVWDLDSVHGAPLPSLAWFQSSVPDCRVLPAPYHPMFRTVPGDEFDAKFSSDRSHMRDDSGVYVKPPPDWSAPFTESVGMVLDSYRSIREGGPGRLLDVHDFFRHIS